VNSLDLVVLGKEGRKTKRRRRRQAGGDGKRRGLKTKKSESVICEYCNKPYANKWSLKEHSSIHTGETPFVCEICDKRFRLKYGLVKHKSIHDEVQQRIH
jgi:uncharacterized Zn-finger protein